MQVRTVVHVFGTDKSYPIEHEMAEFKPQTENKGGLSVGHLQQMNSSHKAIHSIELVYCPR